MNDKFMRKFGTTLSFYEDKILGNKAIENYHEMRTIKNARYLNKLKGPYKNFVFSRQINNSSILCAPFLSPIKVLLSSL